MRWPGPFAWQGLPRLLPLALLAAFLVTRLFHLGLLPMVSDEGTYVTWGVRALYARSFDDWLASLEDGKQPLLAWLMPPLLALFQDRLIAGRLVSVLCGLANVALLSLLGRRLYGAAAGWIAAALYVVVPIALVHDRMALYDSLVTTTSLATLLAALAWADLPSGRRTTLLGLVMGAALLTKLSALFFVALVPLVVLFWNAASLRRWWRLAQAFFLAAAIYSVLYLSPIVGNIEAGNFQRYSLTAGEVLRFPWDVWWKNVIFLWEAATTYLGGPLTLLAVLALAWSLARDARRGSLVALWVLLPLLGFVLTAKIIYSRYVVFCFVAALLPVGAGLVAIARRRVTDRRWAAAAWALGLAAAVPGVLFAWQLLGDPLDAPWMNDSRFITDRFQYVESNYAGYGLREIVDSLRQRAATQPIVVLARSATGMPRDGVSAYLLDWPNVLVDYIPEDQSIQDHLEKEPDRAYLMAARGADLFYVLSDAPNGEQERRFRALNPSAQLIAQIAKPGNHSRFQLYETRWAANANDVWLDTPVHVGPAIDLIGYRLSSTSARPGDTLGLVLYWQAVGRPAKDYTVFNHVAGTHDSIWGQQDGQPGRGRHPTGRWLPGDVIADSYDLPLRADTPPGTYDLETGMYELKSLQRLPVTREGAAPDNRLVLAKIAIGSP